jgi:hypothetical protein
LTGTATSINVLQIACLRTRRSKDRNGYVVMYANPNAIGLSYQRRHPDPVLVMISLIWLAIIAGFGPDLAHHIRSGAHPYPLIVHIHAVAFVGWLMLLTAQALLICFNRRRMHRTLGVAGVALAAGMIILGPVTALHVDSLQLGTPESDVPFLSTQLSDIIAFAGLVTAAIALRNVPASHKRLILLATLYITDAGFGRIMGTSLEKQFGSSFWPYFGAVYLGGDLLIASIGIYNLCARRRLYPAYSVGIIWVLAWQTTAAMFYFAPFWKPVALALIGLPMSERHLAH